MGRRRNGAVRETAEDLEHLASRYAGTTNEARLRMLLALRREPGVTLRQLSTRLDRCERQLQRWWTTYRDGGLRTLLGEETGERVTFSFPAIGAHSESGTGNGMSGVLLRFFNDMPTTHDPDLWMVQFLANLKSILHGVDLIILNVSQASSGALRRGDGPTTLVNRQHEANGLGGRHGALASTLDDRTPGQVTVAQAIQRGLVPGLYHPPIVRDYYANGNQYVGTIVLWRELGSGDDIPRATVDLLDSLGRFIAFAFSDCMVRRISRDPHLQYFHDIIEQAADRVGLSERERVVFVLLLAGLCRREIAERLHITPAAVAKRTSRIHAKAGTRNLVELFVPF